MTRTDTPDPGLDPDLMAYVDGTLAPERMAEIEARLAHDAQAREAVAQWRHFDNLLHDYAASADDRPENLQIAALERQLARKLQKRRWRVVAFGPVVQRIAASVLLFAAGWGTHALYGSGTGNGGTVYPQFVSHTLAEHSAYKLAAFERASFEAYEMDAALDWMSKQMQQKIDSPKLDRLGYQVETARLAVVDNQPVAVFYYRNPDNERITVSMTPRALEQPDYSLRVAERDGERMAYWSSEGLHYTVIAATDAGSITTLAAAVQE